MRDTWAEAVDRTVNQLNPLLVHIFSSYPPHTHHLSHNDYETLFFEAVQLLVITPLSTIISLDIK